MNDINVHVILPADDEDPRVWCYCSIVVDDALRIGDAKLVEAEGGPRLVMPQRELRRPCSYCGHRRVRVRDRYCGACGACVGGSPHLKARECMRDVAYPVTAAARTQLETAVLAAYHTARGVREVPA